MPIQLLQVSFCVCVCVLANCHPAAAQETDIVANKKRLQLSKVDVGMDHHFRSFNYEPSRDEPLRVFSRFFVPLAVSENDAVAFPARYAAEQRQFEILNDKLFRQRRNDKYKTHLNEESLNKWVAADKLFEPHNAAHAKDVGQLIADLESACGPVAVPTFLSLGVAQIVAQCGTNAEEAMALTEIEKQAIREFVAAKEAIRKPIFEKPIKNQLERMHYSRYVWLFDCEEKRQSVNASAVEKMLRVFPSTRQPAIKAFVDQYRKFETRAHTRNKELSDKIQQIDPKAGRILPVNLLVHSFDTFEHIFAVGTRRSRSASEIHYAEIRLKRESARQHGAEFIANSLPAKYRAPFTEVYTALQDYHKKRNAIWEAFSKQVGRRYSPRPDFNYQLASIAALCKITSAERSAIRKLDQTIAAKFRKVHSATMAARGWRPVHRKIQDTRPEVIAWWEDDHRVAEAITQRRERESFAAAEKLVSTDKQSRFRDVAKLYVDASDQTRLLSRERIHRVVAAIGARAIRDAELE